MEIVVFALGALAVMLTLVAMAVPLARHAGLPLPVVLAGAGLAYGGGAAALGLPLTGAALDGYDAWFVEQLALDDTSLLYIFLPPLLFEMAMAVDVRRMLDEIPVILVMAVLAVAAATLVVGLSVWSISSLGLIACLMLGAAVATTDPAAVISAFSETGAPKRLLVILEGESLLNDAAAIAIFTLLLSLAGAGAGTGAAEVLARFFYDFLGGAATGLAMSLLAARLYPLLDRSALAETSLTVALAYGAYLTAETVFAASGVVSVVFAGLATGSVGFVRMGPRNWSSVRAVWAQIGFWASALILLLVAVRTPGVLAQLPPRQAALAVVVYLGAMLARALILFGALPLLDRLGRSAPMDRPQKLLALWGGVRGAVTLVLALSLAKIGALGDDAPVVSALAALFTLATLFLNASTMALAMRRLGLDQLSPTDQALRELIVAGAIDQVRSAVDDIASQRRISPAVRAEVEADLDRRRAEVEADAEAQTEGLRIPFGERLRLGLAILCGQEARLVRRAFEDGAIGPRATNLLRLTAGRIADAARTDGRTGYEAAAEAALRAADGHRAAFLLHRRLGLDGPLREAIEFRLTTLMETERVLWELDRFAEQRLAQMIGEDAGQNLRGALAARLQRVHEQAESISLQYPQYAENLERALLQRAAIRRERQQYERLYLDGIIGQELFDHLNRELRGRERVLERPPRLDLTLAPLALLDRTRIFAGLGEAQQRRIAEHLRVRVAGPGEVVLTRGSRGSEMYFVVSGALEERGEDDVAHLSNGDAFGESALVSPGRRDTTEVVSLGFSRLLSLSRRDFQILVRGNDELARRLTQRVALTRFVRSQER